MNQINQLYLKALDLDSLSKAADEQAEVLANKLDAAKYLSGYYKHQKQLKLQEMLAELDSLGQDSFVVHGHKLFVTKDKEGRFGVSQPYALAELN